MKKKDQKTLFIFGIIVALIIGFAFGTAVEIKPSEHNAMDDDSHTTTLPHGHELMVHEMFNISKENAPSVALIVHEDPKSGWNLQIKTTQFQFSPENASTNHVTGNGHAHLFIDGEKITRLYGEWYHIPELTQGEHSIMVTLNTNDHKDYAINGAVISAMKKIEVTN